MHLVSLFQNFLHCIVQIIYFNEYFILLNNHYIIIQNVILKIEQLSGNMDAGNKKDGCTIA